MKQPETDKELLSKLSDLANDRSTEGRTCGGIKWAEILGGNGNSKVMPPLPVEIKEAISNRTGLSADRTSR